MKQQIGALVCFFFFEMDQWVWDEQDERGHVNKIEGGQGCWNENLRF